MELVVWADTYKNVYEMDGSDRPPPDVIDNDVMLDKYLRNLVRKRQQKST